MDDAHTITVDIIERSSRGLAEPRYDIALKFSGSMVLAYKLRNIQIMDEFVAQLKQFGQVEVMDNVQDALQNTRTARGTHRGVRGLTGDRLLSVIQAIEAIIDMRNAGQPEGDKICLAYDREDIVHDLKWRQKKTLEVAKALVEGGFSWDEASQSFVLAFRDHKRAVTAEERQSREAALKLVETRIAGLPFAVSHTDLGKSPEARAAGRFYDRIELRLEARPGDVEQTAQELNATLLGRKAAAAPATVSSGSSDPRVIAWRVLQKAGVLRDGVDEEKLRTVLSELVDQLEEAFRQTSTHVAGSWA